MSKFHVGYIGGNDREGYSCFIHSADCADIAKESVKRRGFDYYSNVVEGTLEDAINSYLDEEMREMGWEEDVVTVFPCAEELEARK